MEEQFKVGDVVQLKSGGPKMTIEDVSPDLVEAVWFGYDGTMPVLKEHKFRPGALEKAK